jgi:hypothetical protein
MLFRNGLLFGRDFFETSPERIPRSKGLKLASLDSLTESKAEETSPPQTGSAATR